MAIEVLPIPLPPSANPAKFGQMGREIRGVNPGNATEEELKQIQDLLYKVRCATLSVSFRVLKVSCAARHTVIPGLLRDA